MTQLDGTLLSDDDRLANTLAYSVVYSRCANAAQREDEQRDDVIDDERDYA
jgi:hypothetical protein